MTDNLAWLAFKWDGLNMVALNPPAAERLYDVGGIYRLSEFAERSEKTHNHYFAAVKKVWDNLPEAMIERWPSPKHLRKYALMRTGYRNERSIVTESPEAAERVARFIRPMDEFAIISITGNVVIVYTAQSQNVQSMGRETFQTSKQAVLEYLAGLIGVAVESLHKNAEEAA